MTKTDRPTLAELAALQAAEFAKYAGNWTHDRSEVEYVVTGAITLCCSDAPDLDDEILIVYERADSPGAPRFCRPWWEIGGRFTRETTAPLTKTAPAITPDDVSAWLRTNAGDVATEALRGARVALVWRRHDDHGEVEITPDGDEIDVWTVILDGLGGHQIGGARRYHGMWTWWINVPLGVPAPAVRTDRTPRRLDAERACEEAAHAVGYLIPWRPDLAAPTPPTDPHASPQERT